MQGLILFTKLPPFPRVLFHISLLHISHLHLQPPPQTFQLLLLQTSKPASTQGSVLKFELSFLQKLAAVELTCSGTFQIFKVLSKRHPAAWSPRLFEQIFRAVKCIHVYAHMYACDVIMMSHNSTYMYTCIRNCHAS